MSVNKNALIRYKILDRCFGNPAKRYFMEDLIEECEEMLLELNSDSSGISREQIFKDIKFMESREGWNIELQRLRDGRRTFYRYADPSFSINQMPLNEMEITRLRSAIEVLSQFKGMPQFDWMNEILPKLKQGISVKEVSPAIMEFDHNPYLKGIERLGFLYNAIYYKKVLQVSYQPFENEAAFNVTIHPYFLRQYNNRWFLFGYNPEKEKYDWNLALDRINDAKEIKGKYRKNNQINWAEYFDDIIGVTKPEKSKLENIILNFFGKSGRYIATKPLHGSQKTSWLEKSTLEVKLQVIVNYELERLILSYGDTVKVVTPAHLTTRIKEQLANAAKIYLE